VTEEELGAGELLWGAEDDGEEGPSELEEAGVLELAGVASHWAYSVVSLYRAVPVENRLPPEGAVYQPRKVYPSRATASPPGSAWPACS
ncbi:hypothetical protein OFC38_32340, partial [Escherichia coli]|nr:hypothetical protein [Escherichia coli]